MTASLLATIKPMAEQFLAYAGAQNLLAGRILTGLREERRFRLLAQRCPVCKDRLRMYSVECRATDARGNPVGKSQGLPLPSRLIDPLVQPRGALKLGVCPNGHKVGKIRVWSHQVEGLMTFSFDDTSKALRIESAP